jgi:predicted xylose isomerase-like sugar epimerase
MAGEPIVAKRDRFGVQVVSIDAVALFGKVKQQAPRSACRLKQAANLAGREPLATLDDEFCLRRAVGSEDEVLVLGMVVDRFNDRFDFVAQ